MAHAKSAIKRHRQSLKHRARNRTRRTEARHTLSAARDLATGGRRDEAEAAVRRASSLLDRAARKGVVHRNTVARHKSRLMRRLNASSG
jgi:small subunit ribosomal protein S20